MVSFVAEIHEGLGIGLLEEQVAGQRAAALIHGPDAAQEDAHRPRQGAGMLGGDDVENVLRAR